MPKLPSFLIVATIALGGLAGFVACGPVESYSRIGIGTGAAGSGGAIEGTGGTASGGMPGSGGVGVGGGGPGGTPVASGGKGATPGSGGSAGQSGGGKASGGGGAPAVGGKGGTSSGGTSSGGTSSGGTSSGGSGGVGGAGRGGGGATASGGGGGAASGGAAGGPSQLILSIDFVGGGSSGGAGGAISVAMGPSEVAGVKPASHWNSAAGPMGSLSMLTYSTGSAVTGASATWDAPLGTGNAGIWRVGYTDAPGDVRMMNGCLNPGWTGSTPPTTPVTILTVSGLPAPVSAGYDVYVYVLGGITTSETRSYDYAINATTINVQQVGPTPTTTATPYVYKLAPNAGSGNYIVFKNVTGASFNLKAKPGPNPTTLRAPVNGIQVVWPSGS